MFLQLQPSTANKIVRPNVYQQFSMIAEVQCVDLMVALQKKSEAHPLVPSVSHERFTVRMEKRNLHDQLYSSLKKVCFNSC